jgi:hypothetical protein
LIGHRSKTALESHAEAKTFSGRVVADTWLEGIQSQKNRPAAACRLQADMAGLRRRLCGVLDNGKESVIGNGIFIGRAMPIAYSAPGGPARVRG